MSRGSSSRRTDAVFNVAHVTWQTIGHLGAAYQCRGTDSV